jgi:hypothetical protein
VYWHALTPAHMVIFSGLANAIATRAAAAQAASLAGANVGHS